MNKIRINKQINARFPLGMYTRMLLKPFCLINISFLQTVHGPTHPPLCSRAHALGDELITYVRARIFYVLLLCLKVALLLCLRAFCAVWSAGIYMFL